MGVKHWVDVVFNLKDLSMKKLIMFALLTCALSVQAEDYAAWNKVNKDSVWTQATEVEVKKSNLTKLNPSDIDKFCLNYPNLSDEDKTVFWVGLISIMARPESNFKPESTYIEKTIIDANKKNVVSRGLLQISQESANSYGCNIKDAKELHNPLINLSCGVKILDKLVTKDNIIGTYGPRSQQSTGGGKYWSVLRDRKNHFPEITGFTNKLNVCVAKK